DMAAWHELDCDKSTEWPVPCRENQRYRTLGHCLSHGCETGPCQRRGSTTRNARLAIRLCCVSFEAPAGQLRLGTAKNGILPDLKNSPGDALLSVAGGSIFIASRCQGSGTSSFGKLVIDSGSATRRPWTDTPIF